eukprot:UN30947
MATCCLGCGNYCAEEFRLEHYENKTIYSYDDLIKHSKEFDTGDLLLVHNDHGWYTMCCTNSRWTHVAVVYRTDDEKSENKILCAKDRFLGEKSTTNILVMESTYGAKNRCQGVDLKQIDQWGKTVLYRQGYYVGYRKLEGPRTDEMKKKWEEGFHKLKERNMAASTPIVQIVRQWVMFYGVIYVVLVLIVVPTVVVTIKATTSVMYFVVNWWRTCILGYEPTMTTM